jgi:L-lactate dehydrogenase complex protein LldE
MRVGLFVTCLVDAMRPGIGLAALELLERAGCEVYVPMTQTCCGQPGWNSGDRPSTRRLAKKLIAEFEGCDYVVVPSGSCAGMMKVHYADVFAGDTAWLPRVEALADRTRELADFLVNVVRVESVRGRFDGTVTYHDSCSGLRELGIKAEPRKLLALVPGLELAEMEACEVCCGFGGTFAVKYGEISSAIAGRKCRHILETGARAVALGDLGCMLNIEGKLREQGDESTQVLHFAELLAGRSG